MILPSLVLEKEAWLSDELLCGIDEVGRGCLAGPVVAAAVVMPKNHKPIIGVRDSKKLSSQKREELFDKILDAASDFGIGLLAASKVDEFGIVIATKKAMVDSVRCLSKKPDYIIIDAITLEDINIKQKAVISGDELCYSVACASVLAKVFRDRIMSGLDNIHPEYLFSSHKGYGTKFHYEAIKEFGLTEEHRKTFLRKVKL